MHQFYSGSSISKLYKENNLGIIWLWTIFHSFCPQCITVVQKMPWYRSLFICPGMQIFFKLLGSCNRRLVPLFWISGDVSSGFQSQGGFCLNLCRGTFPEIHVWCYTCWPLNGLSCSQSLSHMHQQRWELARFWTGNHPDRRATSEPGTQLLPGSELWLVTLRCVTGQALWREVEFRFQRQLTLDMYTKCSIKGTLLDSGPKPSGSLKFDSICPTESDFSPEKANLVQKNIPLPAGNLHLNAH